MRKNFKKLWSQVISASNNYLPGDSYSAMDNKGNLSSIFFQQELDDTYIHEDELIKWARKRGYLGGSGLPQLTRQGYRSK